MSWIKVRVVLPREPRVMRLAMLLGVSRHEALGLLVEWFCWLDGVTEDGRTGLTEAQIDELFFCNAKSVTGRNAEKCNFCNAMQKIGWLSVDENGEIFAVNYEENNGESAKKRAQTAKRVSNKRKRDCNAKSVTGCNGKSVTREDKRREEYNSKETSSLNTTVCVENEVTERRAGKPLPETAEEVEQFMKAQAICGLKGEELSACASGFFDDMEACGWTARNGAPLFDWHAAARKYLNTWQRRVAGGQGTGKITYRSELPKNYDL